jgi:hypothetical protein
MPLRDVRFTIRGLMIAVAVAAGLLAVPGEWQMIAAVLSIPCLVVFLAWRLFRGGHRRLAAVAFWGLALPFNAVFAALCASPGLHSAGLFWIWLLVILPALAAFGATWAVLETRRGGIPPRSPRWAWMWVIALAVMPGVTSGTIWPFRLRFLVARSGLDRLADQVEAGHAVAFPQDTGPFRLAACRVDPRTGGVALLVDPNPGGPGGFVRHKGSVAGPYNCHSPIRGDWWHVGLGGGWCYHEED